MSEEARKAAGVLAQCKWLRDQISKWEAQAKDVLAQELSGGERTKAVAMDGTEIGSVTRAEGARSMQIDNEAGFLAWVKQRYPTEVEETVRPAFVKLCAEKVKVLGALPDANGEPCPHVSLVRADPKSSVSLGDNDKALIERMFMSRHIPDVMSELKMIKCAPNPLFPPVAEGDSAVAGAVHQREEWDETEPPLSQTGQSDPEPFIEEGPPNWQESNTFETSDAVRQRRMR
jgi:hypothetical protein